MEILSNIANKVIEQIPGSLGKILIGVIVFFVLYIVINIIVSRVEKKIMENDLSKDKYHIKNAEFVGKMVFTLGIIFDILIFFQIVGFDAGIIMGGISLSIGFAMQSTIQNLVAGIFMLNHPKMKLGEFTQFLEPLKIMGTIEEIKLRYTVIRTFDKRRIIIPNSIIAKTPIRTIKSEPLLRGDFVFIVPRHTPVEQLRIEFIQTINQNKNIIYPEQTNILIKDFTDRGIELKGIFFVNPAKKTPFIVARQIKGELFKSMKRFGIKMPYPSITLTSE